MILFIKICYIIPGKLRSPKIISTFFKETSAASVFGEGPVQRKNNSKLDEIQAKLRFKVCFTLSAIAEQLMK